jgi:hypothetical protein
MHSSISPFFLITLARNQKASESFKLTTLCNILKRAEDYIPKSRPTQCYSYQRFGHIWVHYRQSPRRMWCEGGRRPEKRNSKSVPTCCICYLQDGESLQSSSYRGCSHAKQELERSHSSQLLLAMSAATTITTKTATVFSKKSAPGHQPNVRSVSAGSNAYTVMQRAMCSSPSPWGSRLFQSSRRCDRKRIGCYHI